MHVAIAMLTFSHFVKHKKWLRLFRHYTLNLTLASNYYIPSPVSLCYLQQAPQSKMPIPPKYTVKIISRKFDRYESLSPS